jgi:hypothetical protein
LQTVVVEIGQLSREDRVGKSIVDVGDKRILRLIRDNGGGGRFAAPDVGGAESAPASSAPHEGVISSPPSRPSPPHPSRSCSTTGRRRRRRTGDDDVVDGDRVILISSFLLVVRRKRAAWRLGSFPTPYPPFSRRRRRHTFSPLFSRTESDSFCTVVSVRRHKVFLFHDRAVFLFFFGLSRGRTTISRGISNTGA